MNKRPRCGKRTRLPEQQYEEQYSEIDSFASRLSRRYPRGVTVYVARPTRSIPRRSLC